MKSFVFSTLISSVLLASAVPIVRDDTYAGDASWYRAGLGNCGAQSSDSDFIAALPTAEYGDGSHCWQHIWISHGDKTINAVVVDSCPGCDVHSLDLSPAAFQALAPLDEGVIDIDWWYA